MSEAFETGLRNIKEMTKRAKNEWHKFTPLDKWSYCIIINPSLGDLPHELLNDAERNMLAEEQYRLDYTNRHAQFKEFRLMEKMNRLEILLMHMRGDVDDSTLYFPEEWKKKQLRKSVRIAKAKIEQAVIGQSEMTKLIENLPEPNLTNRDCKVLRLPWDSRDWQLTLARVRKAHKAKKAQGDLALLHRHYILEDRYSTLEARMYAPEPLVPVLKKVAHAFGAQRLTEQDTAWLMFRHDKEDSA